MQIQTLTFEQLAGAVAVILLLVEYEGQNGWVSDKYAEVTEG